MMQVNFATMHTLFGGPVQFEVPVYQRHYVWTREDQWEPLWEDIIERIEMNADIRVESQRTKHFTGAIVIRQDANRLVGSIPKYDIIDGQQRLTTFQIIFCAIADVCLLNKLEIDTAEEFIVNGGLVRSVHDETRSRTADETYKILPSEMDRESFKALIDGDREPPSGAIRDAYIFYKNQIIDYMGRENTSREKRDRLLRLIDSILHSFGVVQILITSDAESEKIFESINARGRTINEFDHLRNNLFLMARVHGLANAEVENVEEFLENLYLRYWQHFDNLFWSEKLGTDADEMLLSERFVQHFLMAKLGKAHVVQRELFKTYDRDYRANLGVERELRELKKYSKVYQVMFSCKYDADADDATEFFSRRRMNLISQRMTFYKALSIENLYPFLLFIINELDLTHEDLRRVFDILESYTIRRLLCYSSGVKNCQTLFAEVITSIDKTKWGPMELTSYLSSHEANDQRWPTDSDVKEALSRCGRPSVSSLVTRYILYRMERLKTDPDVTVRTPLRFGSKLTLEHVMPIKWQEHWVLPDPGDTTVATRRKSAIHSIGNLTLLTTEFNKNLGNLAFSKKRDPLLIHSDLNITKEIVHEYDSEGRTLLRENWDVPHIRKREEELGICFCEEIWRDADWFAGKKKGPEPQARAEYAGELENWHPNFRRGIIIDENGVRYPVERSEFRGADIALLRGGRRVKFEKTQTADGVIATNVVLVRT